MCVSVRGVCSVMEKKLPLPLHSSLRYSPKVRYTYCFEYTVITIFIVQLHYKFTYSILGMAMYRFPIKHACTMHVVGMCMVHVCFIGNLYIFVHSLIAVYNVLFASPTISHSLSHVLICAPHAHIL